MPHPVDPATHATHDPGLVAAYAAGDATGADLDAALALVAACPGCATLHRDLRAIAAALPAMPAPRRPRDFRLTADQAASLRPGGWRRWLAPFAGPRFAFAAPLGSGLAALGIVGVLLAGPGLSLLGDTSGGAVAGDRATANGTAGPHFQGPVTVPEVQASDGSAPGQGSAVSNDKGAAPGDAATNDGASPAGAPAGPGTAQPERFADEQRDQAAPPASLAMSALAGVSLAAGLFLVGLRVMARRTT